MLKFHGDFLPLKKYGRKSPREKVKTPMGQPKPHGNMLNSHGSFNFDNDLNHFKIV